jgi:hypothetical protein
MPIRRSQFRLKEPPFGTRLQLPAVRSKYPSFVSAEPAAWKLRSFRSRGDRSYPILALEGFTT